MNRLTLLTICLLAWTANVGFCQDQPLTAASEPQQAPSQAETSQPAKSESAGLADTLFKGEWKLNSTKLIFEGFPVEVFRRDMPQPESARIRDGVFSINEANLKYDVISSRQSEGTIRIRWPLATPERIGDSLAEVKIERMNDLLLLSVSFPRPQTGRGDSEKDASNKDGKQGREFQAEGIFLEFWRVNPNRRRVVERLEMLHKHINEIPISGHSLELKKAKKQLQMTTAQLKKVDLAPKIASLRYESLLSRRSGNHEHADSLASQIAALDSSDQTSGSFIPPGLVALSVPVISESHSLWGLNPGTHVKLLLSYEEPTTTQTTQKLVIPLLHSVEVFDLEGTSEDRQVYTIVVLITPEESLRLSLAKQIGSILVILRNPPDESETTVSKEDSVDRQTLLIRINAAKLKIEQFEKTLGPNHSKVIEIKRNLKFLQSLFDQNATASPTSERPLKSRAQLAQSRDQLLIKYAEAEQRARDIAAAQKPADDEEELGFADKVTTNHQRLTQAVRTAFDLQQQLQDVRLQLAELDLQELRSKHQRRTALADKVIERRVQQLQEADEKTDQPLKIAATPAMRAVKVPLAMNALAPYTRIDKLDVATAEVITDELSPISYAEVVGKYLNQRLKPRQRITRDMLVEDPTTEQIVAAALNAAKSGEEVLRRRRRGFPSLTFPQLSHQVVGVPYRYDPLRFYSELPDWTEAYITAVIDRLRQKPTAAWSEEEFHLLWSMELLVTLDTDDSPYDLRPLAQLIKDGLTSGLSDEDSKSKRSPRWHSALTYGIAARLDGTHTELLFKQPVPADNKQTELLKKMCANKAESKWIKQEQVRLAGMLQERPLQTLTLLLQGEWPAENKIATNWLYALSTAELYESYRNPTMQSFTSPVDTLLLVLTMNHLAGESVEIDEHIAVFFTQPSPDYAFLAHLDDLLSSKLSYRATALEALTQIYQKTSNQRLKAAIKKVAPGACILGVRL